MSLLHIPFVSYWLLNRKMLIDELRRANLALLAKEAGGVGKLAERLEKDQSQISQWLNASKNSATGRPRGMRSDTCRYVEERTGKPRGWLDLDHNASTAEWLFTNISEERLRRLSLEQLQKLEMSMLTALQFIEEASDAVPVKSRTAA